MVELSYNLLLEFPIVMLKPVGVLLLDGAELFYVVVVVLVTVVV